MKIKPLRDQVLIEPLKEEIKRGGIILPDTAHKERPEQGKVVAVGAESKLVKKGDVVRFKKYSDTEIEVDGKKYWVVKEEDLLAIIA